MTRIEFRNTVVNAAQQLKGFSKYRFDGAQAKCFRSTMLLSNFCDRRWRPGLGPLRGEVSGAQANRFSVPEASVKFS